MLAQRVSASADTGDPCKIEEIEFFSLSLSFDAMTQ